MSKKVPTERKARSAGISLEPDLIAWAKEDAEREGLKSLSALIRQMLITRRAKKQWEEMRKRQGHPANGQTNAPISIPLHLKNKKAS